MDLAASLGAHLAGLTFADRTTDEVTGILLDAIVAWGRAQGWRVYRRAASVVPLPPPYEDRFSVVDVGCARADGPPVVIEIDHADRRRTVDKLVAEAAAGRTALWVRWGGGKFTEPPAPVRLVAFRVTSRAGLAGQGRLHSHGGADRPAPEHTGPAAGDYTPETMPLPD